MTGAYSNSASYAANGFYPLSLRGEGWGERPPSRENHLSLTVIPAKAGIQ
ncbi:hypothetical protein GCM10010981_23070 [Dyella nitratireducens]|uniref:Uncharacterized protein n=1 Tax=Dyella nitratireducens TaxID=1849580 RepID=A0ABQ1FZB1_9GAMM|nr:hypothetical protein GCM10010981_23070 [Dyella nitratireducens]GLQ40741.1 hypothetical protein GCM10007902_05910 [Dyella nitratireducens]